MIDGNPCAACGQPSRFKYCRRCLPPQGKWPTRQGYIAARSLLDSTLRELSCALPAGHPVRAPQCAHDWCDRRTHRRSNNGVGWRPPGKYCVQCIDRRKYRIKQGMVPDTPPWAERRRRTQRSGIKGYLVAYCPTREKWILEHRLVMEEHLGRQLQPFENVHHRNGVRTDNRIDNLELWCVPQPKGQRVDDLIDWLLTAYPERVLEAANLQQSRA